MNNGLSFLGTGDYKEIHYEFDNVSIKTNLFPFAFCKLFNISKLFLVMTQQSKEKHYSNLISQLASNHPCEIVEIIIPTGKNEKELWEIFDSITSVLPENIELFYDVTHSFRSIPLITIAICNYLTVTKNIKISKIVYGAYEAKQDSLSPVFDLTQFLDLIEWTNSINQFIKFGNSTGLQNLLRKIHSTTYKKNSPYKSQSLSIVGDELQRLTAALSVARIKESIRYGTNLLDKLKKIEQDFENIPEAKPFKVLLNKIKDRFSLLALHNKDLFSTDGFNAQLKMLEYYLETENYMQAVSLAREIVVSFFTNAKSLNPTKRENREEVERFLGELSISYKNRIDLKEDTRIAKLWDELTSLRNDIDHCGMNENPTRSERAIKNINSICQDVINLIRSKLD